MNIATILAIGIIVFIVGFILFRRSKKQTIGSMKSTGMVLIAIGAFVIIWFIVEFIMFILNP